MEIKEFQDKLTGLTEEAIQNGKKIRYEVLRGFLQDADLGKEQASAVLQYLNARGISIEDAFTGSSDNVTTDIAPEDEFLVPADDFPGTRVPLSQADQLFLQSHLDRLEEACDSADYMPLKIAAMTAADYNCVELNFPDLLQEASLAALAEHLNEEEIRSSVYRGICEAIRQQSAVLDNDRQLVSRVEKLDQAIKDLTDEGESVPAFSAAELAVILDTEPDELRRILKLTGDEI